MDPGTICLHAAVKENNVELVTSLLGDGGCSPNAISDGINAFHVAVAFGSVECLWVLLEYCGCDPHVRSPVSFLTPIELGMKVMEAFDNCEDIEECIEILKKTPSYKQTTFEVYRAAFEDDLCLIDAIENHDIEMFMFYINDNPSLLSSFPFPLFFCVEHEFDEAIAWAVNRYNVNLDVKNLEGLTLLAFAALKSSKLCFSLISYGASTKIEVCPGVTVEDVMITKGLVDE
jgi:hypothetical protein